MKSHKVIFILLFFIITLPSCMQSKHHQNHNDVYILLKVYKNKTGIQYFRINLINNSNKNYYIKRGTYIGLCIKALKNNDDKLIDVTKDVVDEDFLLELVGPRSKDFFDSSDFDTTLFNEFNKYKYLSNEQVDSIGKEILFRERLSNVYKKDTELFRSYINWALDHALFIKKHDTLSFIYPFNKIDKAKWGKLYLTIQYPKKFEFESYIPTKMDSLTFIYPQNILGYELYDGPLRSDTVILKRPFWKRFHL